jgi:hypothetical protein
VAGDDHIAIIDQNRVGKAEPLDAVSNLSDLLLRVRAFRE